MSQNSATWPNPAGAPRTSFNRHAFWLSACPFVTQGQGRTWQ
jgi:hypothetical protein